MPAYLQGVPSGRKVVRAVEDDSPTASGWS